MITARVISHALLALLLGFLLGIPWGIAGKHLPVSAQIMMKIGAHCIPALVIFTVCVLLQYKAADKLYATNMALIVALVATITMLWIR